MIRAAIALIFGFALATASGCYGCAEEPPPDDTFDGNVIYGDATPAPDAFPKDALADATMTSTNADGGDAGDAGEARDTGDTGTLTDGMTDGGEDSGVDCTMANPVATVTASQAVTQAEALANMFLEITGTATVSALVCTGCADSGVCTCTCTADISIDGLVLLTRSPCFAPGCTGDECTQVCRPPVLGIEQTFYGRLNVRNSGPAKSVELELFSVSL